MGDLETENSGDFVIIDDDKKDRENSHIDLLINIKSNQYEWVGNFKLDEYENFIEKPLLD